jgi:hypothetical protein
VPKVGGFDQNQTQIPEKLQGQQIGLLSATQDQEINSQASTALIGRELA